MDTVGGEEQTGVSVSYTHLDVYKRQLQYKSNILYDTAMRYGRDKA